MNNRKPDFDMQTIKRLFGYISKGNKKKLALVIITIIINTISVVAGSMYLTVLIDNYIAPMIGNSDASYSTLIHPILVMIGIYLIRNNYNTHIRKRNGKNL
ncbi:MAG: ABC transporter ATP-binding protein [Clostridia bacterium]|nr:ABC transporter ATP-binding protein [Clostridia bacterium]